MRRGFLALTAALAAASNLPAADAPPPARVALKAARMIDGKSDRAIAPAVVLIENDRIVAAGSSVAIPAGTRVIDLGGATLLPGLIDMHDHLTAVPQMSGYQGLGVSIPREALYGAANARRTLEAGFTTVRNVGADRLRRRRAARRDQRRRDPRPAHARLRARARHHGRPLRQQPAPVGVSLPRRAASPTGRGRRARRSARSSSTART